MIAKNSLPLHLWRSCFARAKPLLIRRPGFRNASSFVDDSIKRLHMAPNEKANYPSAGNKRLRDFDIEGGTYVVTGGARGLGLNLAEALCEAGAKGKLDSTASADTMPSRFAIVNHVHRNASF